MSDKKKILLVDDNVSFTESNRDLLEPEGYEILIAHNGEDGLKLAKEHQPDLMILDVMMATDTEGFEVSRKIPESPELQNMKVLLVTGIRNEKQLPFGFEPDDTWLPVEKVLEKPVPPDTLLAEVKAALHS